MVAKILDGKQIAKEYRQRLKNQVNELKEHGFTPKLSVILVGNDGASQSYVRSKKKAAEKEKRTRSSEKLKVLTTQDSRYAESRKDVQAG